MDIDFDSDGVGDFVLDISVEPGITDLFDDVDDGMADYYASKIDAGQLQVGEDITWVRDGRSISGTGSIEDANGVALPYGESVQMTYEAFCS